MNENRPSNEKLAQEAVRWDAREITPAGWEDAPDAAPRAKESVAISIRLPVKMVTILKEFANRAGLGYQVLMKRWLDDRLKQEHKQLQEAIHAREVLARRSAIIRLVEPQFVSRAAAFDSGGCVVLSSGNSQLEANAPAR